MTDPSTIDPFALFDAYLKLTGVASLAHASAEDPALQGRTLGIINAHPGSRCGRRGSPGSCCPGSSS